MIKTKLIGAVIIFLVVSCSSRKDKIIGHWAQDLKQAVDEGIFRIDSISFGETEWEMVRSFYEKSSDPIPFFKVHYKGDWIFEGRSSLDKDLTNIRLIFKKKRIIVISAESERAIKAFYLDVCGLTEGKYRDISRTGCSIFPPISEVPYIYEVVSVKNKQLFMGKWEMTLIPELLQDRPVMVSGGAFNKVK